MHLSRKPKQNWLHHNGYLISNQLHFGKPFQLPFCLFISSVNSIRFQYTCECKVAPAHGNSVHHDNTIATLTHPLKLWGEVGRCKSKCVIKINVIKLC